MNQNTDEAHCKMNGPKNKDEMADRKVNTKEDMNGAVLADIDRALREISYGSVQIHIQDGKTIQIDKVNKVRMH